MLCESSAENKDFDDDTKKTSYNFSCAECAKSFQSARGLKTHYGKIHKKKNLLLSSSVIPEINGSIENDLDSSTSLVNRITLAKHSFRIINRIPKSARYASAAALSEAIDSCIESNSYNSWENLLLFAYNVLAIPSTKNSIKLSLTKIIKENIKNNFNSSENIRKEDPKKSYKNYHNTDISKIILNKVSNGDLTSAVRILSSSDTLAPYDHSTLSVLQTKHPRSSFASCECPIMTPSSPPLQIFKKDVLLAVRSFRTGSASGLDSIRPSHIQDLLSFSAGSAGQKLLNSLTQLCNLMLLGNVPPQICPIIYGASLCALRKRDGGIRPIAIGCFYRRLVAKLCCSMEREQLGTYFHPLQFGFGTHGGCEAVAHSARMFINQHPNPECKVFLKLDFKNAFNMIERKIMLQNVIHFMPKLFPFLNQCYREPSILNFGKYSISSERGIQQGDPLGPALFCLSIHDLVRTISCEFNCWYLDDGSIAGDVYSVLENFKRIIEKSREIGLTLNYGKCELIYLSDMDEDSMNKFRNLAPDIKIIDKTECSLLGIPLTIEKLPEYQPM